MVFAKISTPKKCHFYACLYGVVKIRQSTRPFVLVDRDWLLIVQIIYLITQLILCYWTKSIICILYSCNIHMNAHCKSQHTELSNNDSNKFTCIKLKKINIVKQLKSLQPVYELDHNKSSYKRSGAQTILSSV